jgi:AGCS family alanine or glycine:cation symporter
LGFSFRLLFRGSRIGEDQKSREGDITPYQALTTSLATVVGNGNIAGVATAIAMGGPGAVFWMWVSAAFGMATKMVEAVLGQKFREKQPDGSMAGGPMYYLRSGLGLAWLAGAYAVFMSGKATIATPLIQSNSVAVAMSSEFGLKPWITGVGLAALTWLVIVGGIKTLGKVTEILSPFMVLLYVIGGLVTILIFASNIPKAMEMIFVGAFKPSALGGGMIGVTIARAMRYGMARGNYSNEAGIGTAAVFHAAARTGEPARQGFLGSLDVFIDTIVICTLTALAILTSGAWTQGTSTAMTANAYNQALPYWGGLIVAASSFLFGYSSLIGVTYYGKIALSRLLGAWIHKPYNWIYCVFVFIGASMKVELAWSVGDLVNGLMVVTNVIGVIGLSGLAVNTIKAYCRRLDSPPTATHPGKISRR